MILRRHCSAPQGNGKFILSHRKEYVEWIESAKKAETRANRIAKAIGMIAEKRRFK